MNKSGGSSGSGEVITILLVDDIPEARENIKKMIAFEPDLKVVGMAGTGREGVAQAKELKPNIIIMDINMPDMDGIEATTLIREAVPTAAVIMMSVQNDPDYLRRAMLAGAFYFLPKPVAIDELHSTIRTVHTRNKPIAAQYNAMQQAAPAGAVRAALSNTPAAEGITRPGHIIVVYSPQGGVGCTTIATNLASGLMKEGIRALLVDADLQFGDVGVFLNLQSQSTIVDLANSVEDLDTELFDKIVVTHDTGLKVLLGPARPEMADVMKANPSSVAQIIQKIANQYDFIVIDTSRYVDDTLLSLFDIATKIIVVGMPTLASVKNVRFVLDLFDTVLGYPPERTMLVLNRVPTDRNVQKLMIPNEKIEKFLRRPIAVQIPNDEATALNAMSKGVLIVTQRDRSRSPVKELMQLSELLYNQLMGSETEDASGDSGTKDTRNPLSNIFKR